MRRKMQNDIPAKTKVAAGLFKTSGPPATTHPYEREAAMNPRARNGSPHTGLTTNRQKPGGAPKNGQTTDVDAGY